MADFTEGHQSTAAQTRGLEPTKDSISLDVLQLTCISNQLPDLSWSELSPTDKVLDVACRTGEFERLILTDNSGQQMVGVDISEKMIEMAQQKLQQYPNVGFQHASASALPFPNASFDTIISANSFHYFDNPNVALNEMKRVLKPNGNLIILDWCKVFLVCRVCDWILQRIDPAHQQLYPNRILPVSF